MFREIAFFGGIHGVGKSTICQNICRELHLEYLSASELLKWKDINTDMNNKSVRNISVTQNRLISGLIARVQSGKMYLLDGHYCLLTSTNNIAKVPLNIFQIINPSSLNIILGEISEVQKRLNSRDGKPYDYRILDKLQQEELKHAKYLAQRMGITLNIVNQNDHDGLVNSLRETFDL